jgi:drug/metabolite transporter (DMT)-like permease
MSFQTVLDAQDAQLLSAFDPATTSADSITSGAGSGLKSLSDPTRQYLDVPTKSSYRPRPSIDSTYSELSELSIYSDELRHSRPLISNDAAAHLPSSSPAALRRGWRGTLDALWIRNKGVVLVLLSQAFGSLMNVATRILETDGTHGKAMHPFQVLTPTLYVITQPIFLPTDTQPSFQILFARQSLTSAFSLAYGYYTHIPHFPFGPRNVLPLLIARGVFGFFGVFGLYFALLYLPLAEATVLTFLAPILSCYVCALLIPGESFSRQQQLAAFLSLVGVVVIARPATLFNDSSSGGPTLPSEMAPNTTTTTTITMIRSHHTSPFSNPTGPTPHQHLLAVLVSMLGVVGGCGAMTAIRWIGTRAHPLISVNYFSVWCTLVSLVAVAAVPSVGFRLPANIVEWSLLASLGGCGFFLQFLLTAGLAYGGQSEDGSTSSRRRRVRNGEEEGDGEEEGLGSGGRGRSTEKERDELLKQGSGTRATNMVYSQMLFALMFDKLIWGITPGVSSWAGSGLILVSAVWVAVARDKDQNNKENLGSMVVGGGDGSGTGAVVFKERPKRDGGGTVEEEQGLMSSGGGDVLEEGESSGEVMEMEDLSPKHETERETKRSAIT